VYGSHTAPCGSRTCSPSPVLLPVLLLGSVASSRDKRRSVRECVGLSRRGCVTASGVCEGGGFWCMGHTRLLVGRALARHHLCCFLWGSAETDA
jgi:hypothetical protein